MSGPRRDTRIEETLTFRLLVAVNRIVQPFQDRYGKPYDLTLPEWRCMMALAAMPGASGEDVARHMAMDKMGVSRSLRRLERNVRVFRETDPENARRNCWQMTSKGWALFDMIMPDALDRDRAAFKTLSDEERLKMIRMLRDLELD